MTLVHMVQLVHSHKHTPITKNGILGPFSWLGRVYLCKCTIRTKCTKASARLHLSAPMLVHNRIPLMASRFPAR